MNHPEPDRRTKGPRIGTRYRDWRLAGPYDALIVGSGIGGLATAAFLAELGWKVAVLEQHYTAGGYTHSYERAGYEWDVGLHYVGDMAAHLPPRKVMDFLTGAKVQWASMGLVYDRFFIGDRVYDALAGRKVYRDALVRHFPSESKAIDGYLALLGKVMRSMPLFTFTRLLLPWQRQLLQPLVRRLLPEACRLSTATVLDRLTDNDELKAVLSAQWGDYGLPPRESAFLMHAIVADHYLRGAWYPVGGSWRIAEAILPKIRAAGGEVFTYARVERIRIEHGRVAGVQMADGTRIDCPCVVSDAGVRNTFGRLLQAEDARRSGYEQRLHEVRPSLAHLGVYIGLKHTAEELQLPRSNFWIFPGRDFDRLLQRFLADPDQPLPLVYVSFPSAKDPDFQRRFPGKATIEVVAPANYAWFERWEDTIWGRRGADYEAFKTHWGERLMAVLYDKLPQLRGKVDYMEVSTPLSTRWFAGYGRGEPYGLGHDPQRFEQSWLGPRTRIRGLWLTGQDTFSCGVVAAMMSGMVTALAVAGPRRMGPLIGRVMRGQAAGRRGAKNGLRGA